MVITLFSFTSSNIAICRLVAYGPTGIFYFTTGHILCGVLLWTVDCVTALCKRQYLNRGRRSGDCCGLKVDGAFKKKDCLAFLAFCLLY